MSRLSKFSSDGQKFNEMCHAFYGYPSKDDLIDASFQARDEIGGNKDVDGEILSRLTDEDEIREMRNDFQVLHILSSSTIDRII
jgi:hypothetical protein